MTMKWLALAVGMICLAQAGPARAADTQTLLPASAWQSYKDHFLDRSGRIVDTANGGISHSEGQGYGLLLAAMAGDLPAFEEIWTFTRTQMLVRDDGLAAWKWDPRHSPHVTDVNNATDGDILIAYGLARAASRWHREDFRAAAAAIVGTLADKVLVRRDGRRLLLPAVSGFAAKDRPDGPVVNLSYWVFEAFPVFQSLDPDHGWNGLGRDGRSLIANAAFGERQLPPDWLSLKGPPQPAKGFPAEFGYNAIRIPLYLMRSKTVDDMTLKRLLDGMTKGTDLPVTVNLQTDKVEAELDDPGYRAIVALARCMLAHDPLPELRAQLRRHGLLSVDAAPARSRHDLRARTEVRSDMMAKVAASGILVGLLLAVTQGRLPFAHSLFAMSGKPFEMNLDQSSAARRGTPPAAPANPTETVPETPPAPAPATEVPVDQPVPPQKSRPPKPTVSQTTPPPATDPAAPSANPSSHVDESALRYFARQGDTKRLNAEIARLKALYPNWVPPANPLAVPTANDPRLDAMWKLYAEGKFAELHKSIAERRAREPNWQPPGDLLKLLSVAETRERLVNASDLKQYDMVIRLASSAPSLLTCSEIDMLWRVGEAFAKTDRPQRAEDDYRYILTECSDKSNRLATMQKALALLPRDRVESLLKLEKGSPDGEFASIRDELARRSVAKGGTDPLFAAPAEDMSRLERLAETTKSASDALLLGWYDYRHDALQDAEKWFRKARQIKDSASASQGLGLVLVKARKPAEAEKVVFPWRTSSPETEATYLAAVANLLSQQPTPKIDESVLQRMAAEVVARKDPASAQQFGWYARSFRQYDAAEAWFRKALDWKPADEPSAYGLALTLQSLGKKKELAAFARTWADRSPRIAAVVGRGKTTSDEKKPSADHGSAGSPPGPAVARGQAESAVATARRRSPQGCSDRAPHPPRNAQAALDRGWCLMNIERPMEAARSFGIALDRGSGKVRADAAYGRSLAYLRLGLTQKAAIAATQSPMPAGRRVELQSTILADRARALFDQGHYTETLITLDQRARIAAERTDLMVLRGYAFLKLHRLPDARKVFEAVAATGNRDGIRGLAEVRRQENPQ